MCGIAGIIGPQNPNTIHDMINVQAHRGPDDQGVFLDEKSGAALGSCRLSILDLSPKGHMPMSGADGQVWIVYNGEIYNFQQIRKELEQLGHRFSSRSDTEVVLKAYLQWGKECLSRFRGMFAFAIYDNRPEQRKGGKGKLFLARDRFGIKPLYYAQIGSSFVFASELKSMLASGLVSRELDKQALWDYLSFGSVPLPRTILSDVKSLLPGHYMLVQKSGFEIKRYWDLFEATTQERAEPLKNFEEAKEKLIDILGEVVRMHTVADVPVGAFLSGGVDSSAIVALMTQCSSKPVRTFSVLFENQNFPKGELQWAKQVAERYSTDHTEVVVSGQEIVDDFESIISSIDQPCIDGFNTFVVSKATRSSVKVAMSGLGSDEIFAGYDFFDKLDFLRKISRKGWPWIRPFLKSPLQRVMPRDLKWALNYLAINEVKRYGTLRSRFSDTEKTDVLNRDFSESFSPRLSCNIFSPILMDGLESLAQTTYIETHGYLAHTLLRDTDVMSMAHSLEVRVPFLDHNLVEFAFSLPAQLKIRKGLRKRILVEAVRHLLPDDVIFREKQGFVIPWNEFVNKNLNGFANELLESTEAQQIFSKQHIRKSRLNVMKGDFESNWLTIVLLAWMKNHK